MAAGARHLADPGNARERAGQEKAEPHHAPARESRECAGARGLAADPDLEAPQGSRHEHVDGGDRDQREDCPDMHPTVSEGR